METTRTAGQALPLRQGLEDPGGIQPATFPLVKGMLYPLSYKRNITMVAMKHHFKGYRLCVQSASGGG